MEVSKVVKCRRNRVEFDHEFAMEYFLLSILCFAVLMAFIATSLIKPSKPRPHTKQTPRDALWVLQHHNIPDESHRDTQLEQD